MAKSKEEAKKLVSQRFHKWIHVFRKKASERMLIKKVWDYVIKVKEGFVPKKRKVYPLLRKERGEICKFIKEKLRKRYIRHSKLPQIVLIFFVGKNSKKRMVYNYRYLNE